MNRFLTVREIADALRRRPRYVRGLIRDGRLRALRLVDRDHHRETAERTRYIKCGQTKLAFKE